MKLITAYIKPAILLLVFLPALLGSASAQELVIMTGEWEPYVSAKLENKGFITEIVAKACDAAKLQYSLKYAPWPRCEAEVLHGKALAAFPYTPTKERSAYAYFSTPLAKARTVFFYNVKKLQHFDFTSWKALKPYLITGVRGYYYESAFKQKGVYVDYSEDEDEALNKLFLKRVDLMPLNELVGWKKIEKLYPGQANLFASSANPLDESDLNLMVSKKYPNARALLEQFNQGLSMIQKSGEYKKILVKNELPLELGCLGAEPCAQGRHDSKGRVKP